MSSKRAIAIGFRIAGLATLGLFFMTLIVGVVVMAWSIHPVVAAVAIVVFAIIAGNAWADSVLGEGD